MRILVAYASRHGATRGIAERIAQVLERSGLAVTVQSADEARTVDDYDAFILGSAAYNHHWLSEATRFARHHRAILASRPLWLFSSGPIGTEAVDAKGRDQLTVSEPSEFAHLAADLHPREMRVFYGAYDPDAAPIGLVEKMGSVFMRMPAIREGIPAGDFRDWQAIDAWAAAIANELQPVAAAAAIAPA